MFPLALLADVLIELNGIVGPLAGAVKYKLCDENAPF
jgi:hypothetical protein